MAKIKSKRNFEEGPKSTQAQPQVNPVDNETSAETHAKNEEAPQASARQETPKRRRSEVRRELLNMVRESISLLKQYKMDDLARKAEEFVAKSARDRFSVAFVGEFSHGKSSLINRLLDSPVLPTDDLPTTAMLTRISYGAKPGIEVLSTRGKALTRLPLEEKSWEKLTAFDEDGNANRTYKDGYIRVWTDNEWLRTSGVDFLDTPGANDGSRERDEEISKALMVTDGGVICLDVQKGLMQTQRQFIADRLLGPKIPFLCLALTHLDLIEEKNRDKVVVGIVAALKGMNVNVPFVITNDVTMPSENFKEHIGLDKLRRIMSGWSANPERADRIEKWLAANISSLLTLAAEHLAERRAIVGAKEEDRQAMIIEKQAAITAFHEQWEKLRQTMNERYEACMVEFERKRQNLVYKITNALLNRVDNVPDPGKWYSQSYDYELANQISSAIISLDNVVTEHARNDFEWLNKELVKAYKTGIERDYKIWSRTEEASVYTSGEAGPMKNINKLQEKSVRNTTIGTIAGGLIGALTLGVGGIIGTVGVSSVIRSLSKQKIDSEIAKARRVLVEFIPRDVEKVLYEATRDSSGRVRLIYDDIIRSANLSESLWMQKQHELIEEAAKPAGEAIEKAVANIDERIANLDRQVEKLSKF